MTHEDEGHYAAKHTGANIDSTIAVQVEEKMSEGCISCGAAHKIARDLKVKPEEVGVTIDLLEARITKCQLGLFGYSSQRMIVKPSERVATSLQQAIEECLVNGRLPCAASWEIAAKLNVDKIKVASACEKLKIKMCSCQLGAFK